MALILLIYLFCCAQVFRNEPRMVRLIALVLGIMLCLSVAVGSVAHAAEGLVPLEASSSVISDLSDAESGSPDAHNAAPNGHSCHGHHVGVPHLGVATPNGVAPARVMTVFLERALPSARLRAPIRPPRA